MPSVGGYVLAGGRSSRMGSSKALLQLNGMPLVEHAVIKLGRLCEDVKILGSDPALAPFAPLVADIHEQCGPLGGIEAALLDSAHDWNLVLPVDVPFLPGWYLADWLRAVLAGDPGPIRMSMLAVDAKLHPTLLLIHREAAPFLTEALDAGTYRLRLALAGAAAGLAQRMRVKPERVLLELQWDFYVSPLRGERASWQVPTEAQLRDPMRWFANLNTPEEFAEAEKHAAALDT